MSGVLVRVAGGVLMATLLIGGCGQDAADLDTGDSATTSSTAPQDTASTTAVPPPTSPADIRGTVTAVVPFEPVTQDCTRPEDLDPDGVRSSDDPPVCTADDNDVVGTVLIEEQPDVQAGRKISFTVTTATALDGPGLARFEDLAPGQRVEGWTTGLCAESYPEQCGALAIRLLT